MKYLDEMTKEELIDCAKKEKIFLGLTFNREKIMTKLEKKGYKRNYFLNENAKKSDNSDNKEKEIITGEKKSVVNNDMSVISNKKENIAENTKNSPNVENSYNQGKEQEEKNIIQIMEEAEIFSEASFIYRSRSYYRNYPNKKLMKSLRKKYRKYRNDLQKEIDFIYKGINEEEIKKREKETEINRSKFAKGAEYEGQSSPEDIYFDKAPLPAAYFVDEVVLMPKNPTTLYIYWEIRDDTFEKLAENPDIVDNIVIKLFKDGSEYRKIIRHERIGSHYIGEVDTDQNYEVFIGYEDRYGNFSEVAHSTRAISPSDKLSDNMELVWGTVREDKNTNQIIKYVNSPIPTEENREFIELIKNPENDEEFTVEILERLLKIGSSENVTEKGAKRTSPDKLIMTGVGSS
ncbi:DUF4912 domain-containing protein [Leptotrichia sp. OH3620_COT-345]|uniref:DUF4912 domain-containing protein n=1 Tax=Leptotrichia sp. OH3620_COT-345 TaxID=2491048 RepID=UPI000F652C91|nr:DUF4912 domain-containing protein [Leptotrichia sp. OH3620_COT-345]RRD40083.1 DUF4912 domain-containing protein [Leptotrichia sp. OH3620_COT-345]